MRIIRIRINKGIPDHAAGTVQRVAADDKGVPIAKFWRDRLRDAEVDSCVEVEQENPPPKNKRKQLNNDKGKI